MTRHIVLLCSFVIAVIAGITMFGHSEIASASRVILRDGDLYSMSDAFGEKRLTMNANINIIFAQGDKNILFGKGWGPAITDSEGGGGAQLFLMYPDGSGEKKLSDVPVISGFLSPTEDAVFYTTRDLDVFMTDLEGKVQTKIQEKASGANLSPDGKSLAYQKMHSDWQLGMLGDTALGLTIMNIQTGEEKRISTTWEDFAPLWTPDGKKILFFSANPHGNASHFIVNTDGSGRTQLTNIGHKVVTDKSVAIPSEYPVWSPDGTSLLYESDRQIWINVFNADYSRITDARPIAYGRDPQWHGNDLVKVVVTAGSKAAETVVMFDRNGKLAK